MTRASTQEIWYIDRLSGQRCREIIYGEKELQFLYYTLLGRLLRRAVVQWPWFSGVNGWFKRKSASRLRIRQFIERYGIDDSEAEKPAEEYASLDDFFTRRLRPGARPVCPLLDVYVAPADGRALACRLEPDARFEVKGQSISVSELLLDAAASDRLVGGWALIVRLAPKDYHRFHFSAAGTAGPPRAVAGKLESVHPLALAAGAASFRNRRCITLLQTRLGPLYMVEVGALTVGTIVQTYSPGSVERGAEKGYFRFGGSTVVLLWGREGPQVDADILANSRAGLETLVRYGTQVAAKVSPPEMARRVISG